MANLYEDLGLRGLGGEFHNPDPLVPQHPHRTLILGKSGTGKTVALGNMILGRVNTRKPKRRGHMSPRHPTPYQEVHLFLGQITEDPLYEKIDLLCEGRFHLHTLDELSGWIDERKAELAQVKAEGGTLHDLTQCLVALDDWLGQPVGALVEAFGMYARKLNCSIAYLVQDWTRTPITMRNQCTYLIITHSLPAGQLMEVSKFLAGVTDVSKDVFKDIYRKVTQSRTVDNFLFVDMSNPEPGKVFRRNFDTFIRVAQE